MSFIQNPDCPVEPCMSSEPFIKRWSVVLAASLRRKQEGDSVYFHRVEERLVDVDGEVVLILEGGHIVEVPA